MKKERIPHAFYDANSAILGSGDSCGYGAYFRASSRGSFCAQYWKILAVTGRVYWWFPRHYFGQYPHQAGRERGTLVGARTTGLDVDRSWLCGMGHGRVLLALVSRPWRSYPISPGC